GRRGWPRCRLVALYEVDNYQVEKTADPSIQFLLGVQFHAVFVERMLLYVVQQRFFQRTQIAQTSVKRNSLLESFSAHVPIARCQSFAASPGQTLTQALQ